MKGWLGESEYQVGISGLYATRTAIDLFADADCVIGVGASLNHYTLEGGYIFPNAQYVQIDVQPSIVMGNGKRADYYFQGDARLTVENMERELAAVGIFEHRLPHRRGAGAAERVRPGPEGVRAGAGHGRPAAGGRDGRRQAAGRDGA